MSAGGMRKRRKTFFVQIPRDTIRDKSLSFRARGVLAFLLDMPEGWDVRSEFIAEQGKEGREAVRTALHELGRRGYYRIERRQLSNGTFAMGTSISEERVPEWADEYAEFEGKAVPCYEQKDGSFLVKHKDGTLTSDGFDPEDQGPEVDPETQASAAPHDREPTHLTEDGFSGAGLPGAGLPGSGFPASGSPGFGSLGAIREKENGDLEGTPSTPSADAPGVAPHDDATLFPDDLTPVVHAAPEPQTKSRSRSKGTRIPHDFAVDDDMRAWAASKGYGDLDLDAITEQFFDYWIAKPGQQGIKLDWVATWRMWIRRDQEFRRSNTQQDPRQAPRGDGMWTTIMQRGRKAQ